MEFEGWRQLAGHEPVNIRCSFVYIGPYCPEYEKARTPGFKMLKTPYFMGRSASMWNTPGSPWRVYERVDGCIVKRVLFGTAKAEQLPLP